MLFSIEIMEIMEIDLFSLLLMIILGVAVNYAMLKLLTQKIAPPGKFSGRQGTVGDVGEKGTRGRVGERGPKSPDSSRGDRGDAGPTGKVAKCDIASYVNPDNDKVEYTNDDDEIVGGCKQENNDWQIMGLTSYKARDKLGCLFGYKLESGICKSPIKGFENRTNDLGKFGIKDWEPNNNNSQSNCNYKKEIISELSQPQFKKWAELMYERACPGVPVDGNVPGVDNDAITENSNWKVCSTRFKSCTDCNETQATDVCENSNMKIATAGQVDYAFNNCDSNNFTGKYGRLADGRFAYPLKNSSSSYQAGTNINATGRNDGVFCVSKDPGVTDPAVSSTALTAAPTPAPTPAPLLTMAYKIFLLRVPRVISPPAGSTWPASKEEIVQHGGAAKVGEYARYAARIHQNSWPGNWRNGPTLSFHGAPAGRVDNRLMGQANNAMYVKAPANWVPPYPHEAGPAFQGEVSWQGKTCQQLSDTYGTNSGVSWGRLPEGGQTYWISKSCNTKPAPAWQGKTCQQLSDTYGTSSGKTWGRLPGEGQAYWISKSCNTHPGGSTAAAPPPLGYDCPRIDNIRSAGANTGIISWQGVDSTANYYQTHKNCSMGRAYERHNADASGKTFRMYACGRHDGRGPHNGYRDKYYVSCGKCTNCDSSHRG